MFNSNEGCGFSSTTTNNSNKISESFALRAKYSTLIENEHFLAEVRRLYNNALTCGKKLTTEVKIVQNLLTFVVLADLASSLV